ncbi:hypothetical protein NQZ68_015950 [Dissostichus eleginoides]|nr:hypothetical protein NQZ68_015950 [Dissostichus eleginoides]
MTTYTGPCRRPRSAQLELLEKGLSFIPTPKLPTRPEIRADLHAFHRRIKIMDHFLGSQGREPLVHWTVHLGTTHDYINT